MHVLCPGDVRVAQIMNPDIQIALRTSAETLFAGFTCAKEKITTLFKTLAAFNDNINDKDKQIHNRFPLSNQTDGSDLIHLLD